MHGSGPSPPGEIWTKISLSIGSPILFSKFFEENEKRSRIPLMGSKEWAGMYLRWASGKCAWRYSNGSHWRLNDAVYLQWK